MAERPFVWDGRRKEIISGVTEVDFPKRDENEIASTQTSADYRIIKNWWSAGEENLAKRRKRFNLDEFLGPEGTMHVLSLNEISKALEKNPKSRVVPRARKALDVGKKVDGDNDDWRFTREELLQLMVGSSVLTHYYRLVNPDNVSEASITFSPITFAVLK